MSTEPGRRPVTLMGPHRRARNLNDVVHQLLVVGLVLSTLFFLIGLGLDVYYGRTLPETTIRPAEAIRRALELRPSGFLGLGLMTLIATPIVRVIASIVVFVAERDWRYSIITATVLAIMLLSVVLGQG